MISATQGEADARDVSEIDVDSQRNFPVNFEAMKTAMGKLRPDVVRFEMVLPKNIYDELIEKALRAGQSRAEFVRRILEKSGIKGISKMPRGIGRPRENGHKNGDG